MSSPRGILAAQNGRVLTFFAERKSVEEVKLSLFRLSVKDYMFEVKLSKDIAY